MRFFRKPKPFSAKMTIRNEGIRPRVVWVEPLPDDFTLLPNEELTIVVRDPLKVPSFDILENDRPGMSATQVFMDQENYLDYEVTQNGIKLQSGHNRQFALDAGLSL